MNQNPEQLIRSAIKAMGWPFAVLESVAMSGDITGFRKKLKQRRNELALKCHPDHGGDIEQMKKVNDAYDILMKLKVAPQRPQPQWIRVHVGSFGNATTTSTSYTTTYTW